MTQRVGQNQGKRKILQISGDFELSEFDLSGFNCISHESVMETLVGDARFKRFQVVLHDV